MSSTKETLPKLPAYCLPSFWLALSLLLISLVLSFTDLLHFGKKRAESSRQFAELSHHYRDEVLAIKRAQIDNLKEIKDRLLVLEAAIGKVKPKKNPPPVALSPSAESAVSLESMSDEEYQAMVLEHVKASDKQLVDQHFKQENAFKASLKPSDKQRFDADVKKAYAKLLAHPGMKGELSSLQKAAIHRSAESMTIVEWRTRASTESREAQMRRSNERWLNQQEEKNRLREEERLAKLVERFGPEFLQMMEEAGDE